MNYICCMAATFLAIVPLAAADEPTPTQTLLVSEPWVRSGDTFIVGDVWYRLWGIAAPAPEQHCEDGYGRYRCGEHALLLLRGLLLAATADCRIVAPARPAGADFAGTALGPHPVRCRLGRNGPDPAALMVRAGYAFADRLATNTYLPAESTARFVQAGLWRSTFQYPWDWQADDPPLP